MPQHKDGPNRVTTLFHSSLTAAASGSTDILLRDNGRTRRELPIAPAAPRPCSASSSVPHSTSRGSLNGILSAYSSLHSLFANIAFIVNHSPGFVNRFFRKIPPKNVWPGPGTAGRDPGPVPAVLPDGPDPADLRLLNGNNRGTPKRKACRDWLIRFRIPEPPGPAAPGWADAGDRCPRTGRIAGSQRLCCPPWRGCCSNSWNSSC